MGIIVRCLLPIHKLPTHGLKSRVREQRMRSHPAKRWAQDLANLREMAASYTLTITEEVYL